jgi:hypothetical protein
MTLVEVVVGFRKKWRQQGVSEQEVYERTVDCYLMAKIIREVRKEREERLKNATILKFGDFCKEWKQDIQYIPWRPLIKVPTMESLPYVSIRQAVDETLYRLKTNSDLAEYKLAA